MSDISDISITERAEAVARAKKALKHLHHHPGATRNQLGNAREALNRIYTRNDPATIRDAVKAIEALIADVYRSRPEQDLDDHANNHRLNTPTQRRKTMNTTITFAGNLTDNPQLRYTPNKGTAVATFTVAVNHRTQNAEGQWVEAPATFHDVEVWGTEAENILDSLTRGDGAVVHGQVKTQTWQHDGNTHRKDIVVVNERYGAVGAWLRFAAAKPHKTSRATTRPDKDAESPS